MKARSITAAFAVALMFALPSLANADTTIGSIVEQPGASAVDCTDLGGSGALVGQLNGATVASPGTIASWSVNATGDGSGSETLYVLAPNGGDYTVVGTDTETIPSVIPAGGTVTFTPSSKIQAATGDIFALTAVGTGPVNCAWTGTGYGDQVFVALAGTTGSTISPIETAPVGAALDLPVDLVPIDNDIAVTTAAGPANAIVNNEALLSSTVTDNGPYAGPATFSDTVPAGLAIDAVAAAGGTCTVVGQAVTCTFANVVPGTGAPVEIVVTPVAAGSYTNSVSVADPSGATDPNTANNSASATLVVGSATIANALSTRECVATNVKGLSEKVVKRLLPSMGCAVGKIKKAASKHVAKGDVISTSPGSGAHAPGTKVTITVSSGKPKAKHKH